MLHLIRDSDQGSSQRLTLLIGVFEQHGLYVLQQRVALKHKDTGIMIKFKSRVHRRQIAIECGLQCVEEADLISEGQGVVSTGQPSRLRLRRVNLHRRDVVPLTNKGQTLLAHSFITCEPIINRTCDISVK